jgi:hypothetical protein
MTGQFLQALGDQLGGLGDITAAFRDPRAQEGELWRVNSASAAWSVF